ncbi:hypothetical protein BDN67DRAFT_1012771 [Paxillus ammoniavirescens]|nr:hypothetical protein BDN67DRAFT_1012771 [Paxillus ammoniavirescens]
MESKISPPSESLCFSIPILPKAHAPSPDISIFGHSSQHSAIPVTLPGTPKSIVPISPEALNPAQVPLHLSQLPFWSSRFSDVAKIKTAIWYVDIEEAKLWEVIPEASSADWEAFIKAVKAYYPGSEATPHFSYANLHYLVTDSCMKYMQTSQVLGEYQQQFLHISGSLITSKCCSLMDSP